jgi:hypothetical protein
LHLCTYIFVIKVFLQEHFFHRPNSDPCRLRAHARQCRLLPGVESADEVDDVLETGALQQAAGDHAAVSALAVNRNGRRVIHLWWRDSEVVERPPGRVRNVRGIPLRFATYVEHLDFVLSQPRIKLAYSHL